MWLRAKWTQEKIKNKYPEDLRLNHLIACVQISKEVMEVLDCIPWKFEREMDSVIREKLIIELVDVFKYFCRLLIIHDITPEVFQKAFTKKSEIVERRLFNGELYKPDMEKSI